MLLKCPSYVCESDIPFSSSHTKSSVHLLFSHLHEAAFALQSLGTGLLPRALAVDVEAHVPLLVQVEQLLEELCDVVVGFGRGLHEGALPLLGLGLAVLGLHFPLGLVALVAHQHDRDGLDVTLDGQNLQKTRS